MRMGVPTTSSMLWLDNIQFIVFFPGFSQFLKNKWNKKRKAQFTFPNILFKFADIEAFVAWKDLCSKTQQ